MPIYQITAAQKAEWIVALESGKYKHGQEILRTTGKEPKHCCLGVLVEAVPSLGLTISPDGKNTIDTDGRWASFNGKSCWYRLEYFIGAENIDMLVDINDDPDTQGYQMQIDYIEQKVIPTDQPSV